MTRNIYRSIFYLLSSLDIEKTVFVMICHFGPDRYLLSDSIIWTKISDFCQYLFFKRRQKKNGNSKWGERRLSFQSQIMLSIHANISSSDLIWFLRTDTFQVINILSWSILDPTYLWWGKYETLMTQYRLIYTSTLVSSTLIERRELKAVL